MLHLYGRLSAAQLVTVVSDNAAELWCNDNKALLFFACVFPLVSHLLRPRALRPSRLRFSPPIRRDLIFQPDELREGSPSLFLRLLPGRSCSVPEKVEITQLALLRIAVLLYSYPCIPRCLCVASGNETT